MSNPTSNNTNASGDVLLSARNLSVRFGGVLAVNDVSFDVKRGEVFTLIGPNGAGKTTVFNLITDLVGGIRVSVLEEEVVVSTVEGEGKRQ